MHIKKSWDQDHPFLQLLLRAGFGSSSRTRIFFVDRDPPGSFFCFQRVWNSSRALESQPDLLTLPAPFPVSFLAPPELFVISGIILQLSGAHPSIFPFPKGERTLWRGFGKSFGKILFSFLLWPPWAPEDFSFPKKS